MKTPTLPAFKRWAKDAEPAARAVLMARIFEDMERERVAAYVLPIFQSFSFQYDPAKRCGLSGYITKPDDLYLVADLADPLVLKYYEECDTAHRAHGFKGPKGHCPALTAESLRRETERAFMDLARPLFDIDPDSLYGDNRAKYLELLIGACFASDNERKQATA